MKKNNIIDKIVDFGNWERMEKITKRELKKYLNEKTKILGFNLVHPLVPSPSGLMLYLDNGDDYITLLEIFPSEESDELDGYIAINVSKILKSEIK